MKAHQTWGAALGALFLLTLGCAGSSTSSGATSTSTSASSGEPGASVCTPGMDQTCNDSPEISSLHGTCLPDGTCQCKEPFEKNPATGRCK